MLRLVIVLALVVVACGGEAVVTTTTSSTTTSSTTTTSTTTSTTTTTTLPETTTTTVDEFVVSTAPDDPAYDLLLEGLEQFGNLGDPAQPIIDAMFEVFGEPAADSDWLEEHGCFFEGSMRTITWLPPGLRVVFVDGPSELGEGQHLSSYTTLPMGFAEPATPWEVFGVSRGTNLSQLGELFPDAELIPGPSLDYVRFDPTVLSYAWVDSSGAITDFWAGIEFCGGD